MFSIIYLWWQVCVCVGGGGKPHHMRSGLQVLEVLLPDPRHHLVVVQVLLHLRMVGVGQEEGVGSRHSLVQLVDLSTHTHDRHQSQVISFIIL